MKYNFTDVINRNGKDEIAAEVIPYSDVQVQDEYYDAVIRWQQKRHGVQGLTK